MERLSCNDKQLLNTACQSTDVQHQHLLSKVSGSPQGGVLLKKTQKQKRTEHFVILFLTLASVCGINQCFW